MTTYHDTTFNGILSERIIDNGDGTGLHIFYDSDGTISSQISLTDLPIFSYPPLDSTGALATLLVVLNVIPIADAANVIHEEPEHLVAEAQAWSLGQ